MYKFDNFIKNVCFRWVDQTGWPQLYPTVTTASSVDVYQNYLASSQLGGLLSSSVSAVASQLPAGINAQSALNITSQQRTIAKVSYGLATNI